MSRLGYNEHGEPYDFPESGTGDGNQQPSLWHVSELEEVPKHSPMRRFFSEIGSGSPQTDTR